MLRTATKLAAQQRRGSLADTAEPPPPPPPEEDDEPEGEPSEAKIGEEASDDPLGDGVRGDIDDPYAELAENYGAWVILAA